MLPPPPGYGPVQALPPKLMFFFKSRSILSLECKFSTLIPISNLEIYTFSKLKIWCKTKNLVLNNKTNFSFAPFFSFERVLIFKFDINIKFDYLQFFKTKNLVQN